MKQIVAYIFLTVLFFSCDSKSPEQSALTTPYLLVLGNAQDAGYPQSGCEKACCKRVYSNSNNKRFVSSIALIDPISNENWIFDATPSFPEQLKLLSTTINAPENLPNAIFLTHAHIGHYTGLMHLGREAMGTQDVPVYAMPKLKLFLETNGPWSQLVALHNIKLQPLQNDSIFVLNERIKVRPIQVPHRDEYSETVGFEIILKTKKILFIPDIDKWQTWERDIISYIQRVDIALLDGTFYKDGEIKGRPMSEIPHPFVEESMELFKNMSDNNKQKIYFIHFNHTNPLLIPESEARKVVLKKGFKIATQGMKIEL